ncbi:MAG: T9SS type A sorting domain-containing protein, partial [Candidatus Marinimicrobia bacterium]|nr:T9SS type A sorting domain-containing protein [Candidatus Neomarinimicrobiota bacterium]
YYWSDYDGDGMYYYNQGLDFTTNQADYEECLNKFLIEDDIFPISFRSGWHYMDNVWQAYQERFIPFDMSNCYPAKGTNLTEPINNYIDWSESPDAFVPYHPNADNYQIEGNLKQWRLRSLAFTNMYSVRHVETLFQEAANGNDQMVCLWSHLPQNDFLPGMDSVNTYMHKFADEYGVEFMYAKDVEAMRLWINPEDTIVPVLTVNEIIDGDEIRFEMITDGPVFQVNEPFITIKNKYEEYERMDCSITGTNQWETIEGIPADELAKVSVAVCDSVGNQAKVHLDYVPDDIFIDDRSDEFVEGSGSWQDYDGTTELWDLTGRVLSGLGSVTITPDIEEDLTYSVFFHGPGSTTDSVRIVANNSSINDTVMIDETLLGRDHWQHVGFFELEAGTGNTITFENLDSTLDMGLDVVRITPLVVDMNFVMETDMITFGDISVSDTATYLLKLSNMGKQELNISKFSVFGSKIYIDETFPLTLAPMEIKEIPIKFYADYFCEYNDVLTIETDDPRNPYKLIPIFADASSYFKLVDNEDVTGYAEGGAGWFTSVATAWLATSRCVYVSSSGTASGVYADFIKTFDFSGSYDIKFIIPKTVNAHDHAHYIILIDGVPQDTVVINQNTNSASWVSIGEYDLPKDVEVTLRVQDNGGNTNSGSVLRADAVKFILVEEKFVSSINNAGIPEKFKLFQNYPNPFNPSTQIYFALPEAGEVSIDFFDLQGRKIDDTITRNMEAGYHRVKWSPSNLASGIYFYRVTSPAGMAINKCTFVK